MTLGFHGPEFQEPSNLRGESPLRGAPTWKRNPRMALLLALAYGWVFLVGVSRHEPWRDEIQAWMIAGTSDSIAELVAQVRSEGHPPMWHVMLFVLARFSSGVFTMQCLHAFIALGVVFIFLRAAPFGRGEKALFALGYFPLFEYGVISRNYTLGILGLFTFCTCYARGNHALATIATIGMAASSHHGFLIALPAQILVVVSYCKSNPRHRLSVFGLGAVYVVAALGVAFQAMSAAGIRQTLTWEASFDSVRLARVFGLIWNSWVPIPDITQASPWGTNILGSSAPWRLASGLPSVMEGREWVGSALGIGALFLAISATSKDRMALGFFVVSTLLILGVAYEKYYGWLHHHGHLFFVLVAALWLLRARTGQFEAARTWFAPLLAVHACVGVFFIALDLARPFSRARDVAEYLSSKGLETVPVTASPDFLFAPVAHELGCQFLSLDTGEVTQVVDWGAPRKTESSHWFPLAGKLVDHNRGALMVLGQPLACNGGRGIRAFPLAAFEAGIVRDERFFLYGLWRGDRLPPELVTAGGPCAEVLASRILRAGPPRSPAAAAWSSVVCGRKTCPVSNGGVELHVRASGEVVPLCFDCHLGVHAPEN